MSDSSLPNNGPAPADARPHRPWPVWRKVVAYLALAGLAAASVWYIDRRVHHGPPASPAVTKPQ